MTTMTTCRKRIECSNVFGDNKTSLTLRVRFRQTQPLSLLTQPEPQKGEHKTVFIIGQPTSSSCGGGNFKEEVVR